MSYPTVNYIGNKEKIVDWIASLIPAEADTFFDIFAGGSSVGYRAKEKGLTVYSNDILEINRQLAMAIIENNKVRLSLSDVDAIFSGEPVEGFMYANCSNRFFFPDECRELDKIRGNILMLENPYKRALAFSLMRRAMIRKMPYSRFTINWSKIVELRDEEQSYAKYGRRRAYHNQSFRHHFEDNLSGYNGAVFDNDRPNKAYSLDVFDAIEHVDADVVYLDPPYAGTMNDYFAFYGLLDSYIMAENRSPFANNFTDKKSIKSKFFELFSKLDKYRYWMLSYNSRSTPSKDEMIDLIRWFADDVRVFEMPYAYRVTGKEKKHNDVEYLFVVDNHRN